MPFEDLEQLIQSAFAPDEAAATLALPDHDILPSFLRGWTRKEAVLKAIGTGFGIEPRTVRVPLGAHGLWRVHVPGDPAILDLIDISHAGVVAALASDLPPAMLRFREFDLDVQH
ncbi:phosphopantetheinyl transferase [Bradyrhizobium sp. GM5.1]